MINLNNISQEGNYLSRLRVEATNYLLNPLSLLPQWLLPYNPVLNLKNSSEIHDTSAGMSWGQPEGFAMRSEIVVIASNPLFTNCLAGLRTSVLQPFFGFMSESSLSTAEDRHVEALATPPGVQSSLKYGPRNFIADFKVYLIDYTPWMTLHPRSRIVQPFFGPKVNPTPLSGADDSTVNSIDQPVPSSFDSRTNFDWIIKHAEYSVWRRDAATSLFVSPTKRHDLGIVAEMCTVPAFWIQQDQLKDARISVSIKRKSDELKSPSTRFQPICPWTY
jgi:hypothetical protein